MVGARVLVQRIGLGAGALALLAGVTVMAPQEASAASFRTTGHNVNVRAETSLSGRVVGRVPRPMNVRVDCQKQGSTITIGGRTTSWWARLPDYGGFITVAYIAASGARLPGVPRCDLRRGPAITLADLQAMFPGKVGNAAVVQAGLPSLNRAMSDAHVNTPARQAAFLATIAHESTFRYDARESGDTRRYGGRGFIQLTGEANYVAAGRYFGVDLVGNPGRAQEKTLSAWIARWYWTVARDINPMADRLDMGAVNAAIGYPAGPHDQTRCASFQRALKHLSGSVPKGVRCTRPASAPMDVAPEDAKGLGIGDLAIEP